MPKEKGVDLPKFKNSQEISAYISRESLEARARFIFGSKTEFRFLENVDQPYTGIVLVSLPVKGSERFPLVFGVVDYRGRPWIALKSLPTGPQELLREEELKKISGIKPRE